MKVKEVKSMLHLEALAATFSSSVRLQHSVLLMIFKHPDLKLIVKAKPQRDHEPNKARIAESVVPIDAKHAPEELGAVVKQDLHQLCVHGFQGASDSPSPSHLVLKLLILTFDRASGVSLGVFIVRI